MQALFRIRVLFYVALKSSQNAFFAEMNNQNINWTSKTPRKCIVC